jgi:methionyl-tRNA formyltransferase
MVGTLRDLKLHRPVAQDEANATYARKVDKAETRIDWTQPAIQVERQIRAFAPAPGAWFELEGGRYRALEARTVGRNGAAGTVLDEELTIACGNAAIRLLRVQRAGRPAMAASELLRGTPIPVGTRLH